MLKNIYVLEDEMPLLKEELNDMVATESRLTEEKTLANDQGETFHDNPANEDVELQQQMLSRKSQELLTVINTSQVLALDILRARPEDGVVRIGTKVHLIEGENKFSIEIGGYRGLNNRISYISPFAKALIGKEECEIIKFSHNGTTRTIEIEEITNL